MPCTSNESAASCSSNSDEPKEKLKSADSTINVPKMEKSLNTDSDTNADANNDTDKDKKLNKSDDDTACSSASSKQKTEPNESDDQKDDLASSTSKLSTNEETSTSDETLIDVEDPDDYLLYLESILMKIHSRFYAHYDETKQVYIYILRKQQQHIFIQFVQNFSMFEICSIFFTIVDT